MKHLFLNKWLLFDQTCPLCEVSSVPDAGPCGPCQADLPYLMQACPICALPGAVSICQECNERPPIYSKVLAGFNYRFPLPQLIHRVKTGGDPEPLHWLSGLLAERVAKSINRSSTLVPVPMHPWDLAVRGFNQSEVLSRNLARELKLEHATQLLIKTQRTLHQASLNRRERRQNLQGCYVTTAPVPAQVTLIDDVMTTGTTAERLSQILLDMGCKRVEICVLCRTPS